MQTAMVPSMLPPLALLLLALLPPTGSVDLDLADMIVPRAGGQRQWNDMP